jgi:hypothetical protein
MVYNHMLPGTCVSRLQPDLAGIILGNFGEFWGTRFCRIRLVGPVIPPSFSLAILAIVNQCFGVETMSYRRTKEEREGGKEGRREGRKGR